VTIVLDPVEIIHSEVVAGVMTMEVTEVEMTDHLYKTIDPEIQSNFCTLFFYIKSMYSARLII
jgi:hypothetical protein